ncbi:cysteine-rich repeat secretory protein 38 [Phtheirospermum japonicum]|uniref:Cysteine-rich repeat secretory protein 38 n=1 Tax=Phtheirospermum japonicum TaxID=374723 RepID=A0A830CH75_9LAMI|nr:cysteine-rich repeat secretory protein 38 [Phtheirospermum japonicum]
MAVANTYCPDSRGAIIWRDYCMLKYSDLDFLGQIDTKNGFNMESGDGVDFNFTIAVRSLMNGLYFIAMQRPMLFASETVRKVDGNKTLYGMVQCTRDLSPNDCRTCLESATDGLSDRKVGARFVYGSCNLRFEIYPFLNN